MIETRGKSNDPIGFSCCPPDVTIDIQGLASGTFPRKPLHPIQPSHYPVTHAPGQEYLVQGGQSEFRIDRYKVDQGQSPATSSVDGMCEATIGQPQAIASSNGRPKPSLSEGKTSARAEL